MSVDDPYSRVYWRIRSDDRFDGIYANDRHLATWLRLLIAADAVWPAPADLPRSARQSSVSALVRAGLIELCPGDLYRIHGLNAERMRRQTAGRAGASARWMRTDMRSHSEPHSDRIADDVRPDSDRNARRDETRRDERDARAREGLPHLNDTVAKLWEQATGRSVLASGAYAAEYLDDACRRHPPSEVGAAILRARRTFERIPDAAQMVSAMRPLLDPLPDTKAVRSEADAAKRAETSRRNRLLANHSGGYHIDAPDPDCPKCKEVA